MTGNLAGVWRYRVGDYRILCDINDGRLVILVVDVALCAREPPRVVSLPLRQRYIRHEGVLQDGRV